MASQREKQCFSYIVEWDSGKAPNPWWGYGTLAVCKPVIRRTAKEGDLIVGLTPKKFGHELVYAMYVSEVLTFAEYFKDLRFEDKKPDFSHEDKHKWMGDNFYELSLEGHIQHLSAHNVLGRNKDELNKKMDTDLNGINVLISAMCWYFGSNSQKLPTELNFLQVGRGHRCSGEKGILEYERHTTNLPKDPGVYGEPKLINSLTKKLAYLNRSSDQSETI